MMNDTGTLLPLDGQETDKTDKSDLVGNHEFLQVLFANTLDHIRPVLVSFAGSPNLVPSKEWFGHPWQAESKEEDYSPVTTNNYFSLAVFRPDEAGRYRRRK